MTLQDLYNATVDVLRINRTSDGLGGWDETEITLHEDLSCRINWSKGTERIQFDKDTWFRDAKLYCNVIDIKTKDRILYDDDRYDVVNVSDPDEAGKYLIVEIKRIQ